MSNTFFTSDTHFGHKNIIKYTNRPFFDVHDMDEKLIAAWNEMVKPGDTVYHLGDFAFSPIDSIRAILARLNGNIEYIVGNHDKDIIRNRQSLLTGGKIRSIHDYANVKVNGQYIIMCHYAMRVWDKSHRDSWMLYGHSHGSLEPCGKSVDVGVDCKEITLDYRPIHFDEVATFMANRKAEVVDHHGSE